MTGTRRLGTTRSGTRTLLLDAAERLVLDEGYASVTSRRVAAEAGVKPQLVHYYFRSMDDLFVEVFRRHAEAGIQRFVTAMEVHPSLRTVWRYGIDPAGTSFIIEFVALANHRKAIREEIARYARRFRRMQLDAITAILSDQGIPPESVPPVVALLAMTGVNQVMAIEAALGITTGHDQLRQFIEDRLDDAEEPRVAVASGGRKPRTR